MNDGQCGDDVCARSGECLPSASLRQVMVRWTVNGAAPDAATCAAQPDLYLRFDGPDYGDSLRFAPVACRQGSFFVDKLPRRYLQVELGVDGHSGDMTPIDVASDRVIGQAQFDLSQ